MWSSGIPAAIIVFLLLVIFFLLFRQYKQKRDSELELLKQKATLAELEIKVHELAANKFEEYKKTVLQTEQDRLMTEQKLMAEASFEKWKMEYETVIRQDAIKKSQAVTIGKVTEHIIPYFSGIFPYNPKEARFIGSPIDMVVFDGMETDPENISVHFIEVKTATSGLTPKQRAIKYAVLNKRVEWKELRV
ncbi:MAG TPA: Holliday junction resolvase-like protein [Flavisolibacter sp.]|nr:Holliday junction resolvase-like protein [Flavisolibacter sp.]